MDHEKRKERNPKQHRDRLQQPAEDVAGHSVVAIGYWLLVIGCWLLAIGVSSSMPFCRLAVVPTDQ
jgi:hypothetical protein